MKILVSACLLGLGCRYDGQAKCSREVLALNGQHTLIPFCPEIYGGLPIPRLPAEIRNGRVMNRDGLDVTEAFLRGAQEALQLMETLACDCALLQDRSPSCGCGKIHDGTFTDGLIDGDGLTAALLKSHGYRVLPASRAEEISHGNL